MTWAAMTVVACVLSAVFHLLVVVPRLPRPAADGEDPPPDYRATATPRAALAVALVALAGGLLVLPPLPTSHLLLWFGYLGAGTALVWVDLRTTWLPRLLSHLCLAQMCLGLGLLAATDWRTALAAAGGGLAAFALFHVIWALGSGFGYGDVRLAAIVGIAGGTHGIQHWFTAILAATVVGALWAIAHSLRRRGRTPFPYGPALWLGPVVAMVLGG